MKKILFFILIVGFCSVNSFSQDDEMKLWMEYMTPGKEHQELASMDGDWVYTSKMWMDPSAPPEIYTGTAKCEMILGGRYSQMTAKGNVMGMDFQGISITGFDNAKKVWMAVWVDNMGTGILYMEGKHDPAANKVVYKGTAVDPMTGKDMEMIETFKIVNENTIEMEMFNVVDGKEYKSMELIYTRK